MDLVTMENGGDNEDDDGDHDRESSGDLMGLKGGKGKHGKRQYNGYVDGDSGDIWQSRALKKEKGSKERERKQGKTQREGKRHGANTTRKGSSKHGRIRRMEPK